jgi:hypothetical protein
VNLKAPEQLEKLKPAWFAMILLPSKDTDMATRRALKI